MPVGWKRHVRCILCTPWPMSRSRQAREQAARQCFLSRCLPAYMSCSCSCPAAAAAVVTEARAVRRSGLRCSTIACHHSTPLKCVTSCCPCGCSGTPAILATRCAAASTLDLHVLQAWTSIARGVWASCVRASYPASAFCMCKCRLHSALLHSCGGCAGCRVQADSYPRCLGRQSHEPLAVPHGVDADTCCLSAGACASQLLSIIRICGVVGLASIAAASGGPSLQCRCTCRLVDALHNQQPLLQ